MAERGWTRWTGWTVVAVVAADWISKFLVTNRLALEGQIAVAGRWLYLVRLRNPGISFSVLSGSHGEWRTPLLILASCVGIAALARLGRSLTLSSARAGVALVIAGAAGNLGDRIVNGAVTDFLAVRYFPWVFNLADVAITTGALLMALSLRTRSAPPRATT